MNSKILREAALAYQAVYDENLRRELAEEQVWEQVESWVNSLLEEGYDLSEYTWEEMYEVYLSEAGMDMFSTPASKKAQTKAAVDFFTKPIKPLPPYEARKPRVPALTVPDFDLGSNKKGPRTPTIKRDDARTERPRPPASENPKLNPTVTSAPLKPRPPVTSVPPKAETPKTETPKPTQPPTTTTPTPAPAPAPKGGEVAMSKLGDKSDYSAAATAKMSDRTKNILGTKDSATGQTIRKPQFGMLSPREKALNQSFDLFDVVLGHLLDEGYADTEQAALAIMANMSEEWKQSIVEIMSPAMQKLTSNRLGGKISPASGGGQSSTSGAARPAQPQRPQPPGGLTPMQRLQRRPEPIIR